jgi:hypothetical protein
MTYAEHEEGATGLGFSKAQHFIEHIRGVDTSKDGWRDEQEQWAEKAQMAVCEELKCPVCMDTCKTLTTQHWDINRVAHNKEPVNLNMGQVQVAVNNLLKTRGYLTE